MILIKKLFLLILIISTHATCYSSNNTDNNSWRALSLLKKYKFHTPREKAILFAACNVRYTSSLIHPHMHTSCNDHSNQHNPMLPVSIELINSHVGYGIFASMNIPKGSFIGEFTGEFKRKEECLTSVYYVDNHPTESTDDFVVDASQFGNELRFINDGKEKSNCTAYTLTGHDKIPHIYFITAKNIQKKEQLTIHYHDNYWNESNKNNFVDLTNTTNPVKDINDSTLFTDTSSFIKLNIFNK